MSEHTPTDGTPEVFELQEAPSPTSRSTIGSMIRFTLYGFAAVLLGGLVAVQANPELGEYVAAIPGMSQLAGDDSPGCHACPMSQASACSSSCESACSTEATSTGCCSGVVEETLAARPPAPPMAESIEFSTTDL